ncbi:MAG: hypothetical protein ACQESC_00410 [Nanobdellota archaeon]
MSMMWDPLGNNISAKIGLVVANNPMSSAREVYNQLKMREYYVSYQYVHKMLKTLERKSVVCQQEKKYYLNPSWLMTMKEVVQSAEF